MSNVKEIFAEFDKANVNYCVLRNYDSIDNDSEIDILIKDSKKVKTILRKKGFRKGADYFQYLSMKGRFWLDFRIGNLPYIGFPYKSAIDILKNRRKVFGIWVMSKEDEFIHLILHSILDKNRFKERYKDRIRELFKKIDKGVVLSELKFKFGNIGVNLFYFIDSEKYDEALKLRNRLFLKIFSPIWLPSYFVIKGIRLREKFFKFIEGLSWILYRHLIKGHIRNREEIELDFNKIGINKKFVFRTLEEDTGLSKDLDIFGFREPMNWKNYCDFVEKDDVVLDIGANLGMFSLLSSNAKKIISVEPIKKCLPVLKKNISFNKLKEKSIVVNMAVGEKGELRLRKDERFNRSSVVDKDYEGPIYKIKSEPIEFFVKKYSVNLLRMDVEGYEYNILKNKIPKKINKISLEFHGGIMGKNKSEKLLKHLEKEGFVVTKIIEDLPLRLYPFYKILKKLGLMKKVTRVKENISMKETISFIFSGRNIKYLFLKR